MELKQKVEQWFVDRGLDKAEPSKQFLKLMEETGELFEGIAKNDEALIKDAIGDIQVVLIGLEMQLENLSDDFELSAQDKVLLSWIQWLGVFAYTMQRLRIEQVREAAPTLRFSKGALTPIAQSFNTTPDECLEIAYNEIKDRKGKLVNGVFVKEEDLKKNYVVEYWFEGECRDSKYFETREEAMEWMDENKHSVYDFKMVEI